MMNSAQRITQLEKENAKLKERLGVKEDDFDSMRWGYIYPVIRDVKRFGEFRKLIKEKSLTIEDLRLISLHVKLKGVIIDEYQIQPERETGHDD